MYSLPNTTKSMIKFKSKGLLTNCGTRYPSNKSKGLLTNCGTRYPSKFPTTNFEHDIEYFQITIKIKTI